MFIEKLNPQQYNNLMGVWKNPLGYMRKHITYFQNKIQEWNNLLKTSILQEIFYGQPSSEIYV